MNLMCVLQDHCCRGKQRLQFDMGYETSVLTYAQFLCTYRTIIKFVYVDNYCFLLTL